DVNKEQVARPQQRRELAGRGNGVEGDERIADENHEPTRGLGLRRQRRAMLQSREVCLDPLRGEPGPERAAAGHLEERLARVDGDVGDADAALTQGLEQDEVLVT